jgi:hypothetical protein
MPRKTEEAGQGARSAHLSEQTDRRQIPEAQSQYPQLPSLVLFKIDIQ